MKNLAILTEESEYLKRLSEYIRDHFEKELFVASYSRTELLIKSIKEKKTDFLIIEKESADKIFCGTTDIEKSLERIIILSESREEDCRAPFEYVYKFLPASQIAAKLCTNEDISRMGTTDRQVLKEARLCSFYSPIGNIGTTSLALSYAMWRGEREKTLYISLNPFLDLTEELFLDDKKTLSEAVYSFISNNNREDPTKYIQSTEGFDTIAPLRSFKELSSLDEKMLRDYLCFIIKNAGYDLVIVDYSNAVTGLFSLLGISDKIVITYRDGVINANKLNMFKKEIADELPQEVLAKVKYINIPCYGNQPDNYEQLKGSLMGKLSRNIDEDI